jgi:hypothetical protein
MVIRSSFLSLEKTLLRKNHLVSSRRTPSLLVALALPGGMHCSSVIFFSHNDFSFFYRQTSQKAEGGISELEVSEEARARNEREATLFEPRKREKFQRNREKSPDFQCKREEKQVPWRSSRSSFYQSISVHRGEKSHLFRANE